MNATKVLNPQKGLCLVAQPDIIFMGAGWPSERGLGDDLGSGLGRDLRAGRDLCEEEGIPDGESPRCVHRPAC